MRLSYIPLVLPRQSQISTDEDSGEYYLHFPSLHAHLHCNSRMRIVPLYDEIVVSEIFYIGDVAHPAESRERARLAGKLHLERVDMILVNVCIPKLND